MVWAHHMFAAPLPLGVLGFFMIDSLTVAVPTGIKIFNWLATLWRGNIEFRVPLLFAVGFDRAVRVGGMTGVILAVFPVDWQLTDTYFVVGAHALRAVRRDAVRDPGRPLLLVPEDDGPDALGERSARCRSG